MMNALAAALFFGLVVVWGAVIVCAAWLHWQPFTRPRNRRGTRIVRGALLSGVLRRVH